MSEQSSVEFGEKICKLKPNIKLRLLSCEGARDTEDRMFIVYSGVSMNNAEQGESSSDTRDTLRRSEKPYATFREMFAIVQLLDETPAILLLHQL